MKAKIRKTRIIGFGLIGIAVIAAWLLVLGPRAHRQLRNRNGLLLII